MMRSQVPRVSSFGFRVSDFGFRVSGFGLRVRVGYAQVEEHPLAEYDYGPVEDGGEDGSVEGNEGVV